VSEIISLISPSNLIFTSSAPFVRGEASVEQRVFDHACRTVRTARGGNTPSVQRGRSLRGSGRISWPAL
jgi:hypothetical protein